MTVYLSGCATSGEKVAVPPDLPPLPANLETYCEDPGVSSLANLDEAVKVVGDTRLYAACEKRKHRDAIAHYKNARKKYRGN